MFGYFQNDFRTKNILKISKNDLIEVVGSTFLNALYFLGTFFVRMRFVY